MKQTAVEWLIMQLPVKIRVELYEKNIHEQALQMEKEQIIDANRNGVDMVIDKKPFITGEQYYNETYGK